MIGHITFNMGSHSYRATLDDDCCWQCEDPAIRRLLNEVCPTQEAQRSGDAALARHILYRAGIRLGAEVHIDCQSHHVHAASGNRNAAAAVHA